ncbi:hypothetical protein OBV_32840 [Oscillibacter valericigenes Sjm18-20]|nr:hypothetical protein OBV_32840 [Oscillibacter valericigenes Sjm18-20]
MVGASLWLKIESAVRIGLAHHKTTIQHTALPRKVAAARRDRQPAYPMADRDRGMASPICDVGVVRSFSWRKSPRTRRSPRTMLGAAAILLQRDEKESLIYQG